MLVFLAIFLYLLFCFYLFWRGLRWTGTCASFLRTRLFRIPAGILYWFLATTPVTSFLLRSTVFHFPLKALSNYWLGTFLYLILFLLLETFLRLLFSLTRLVSRDRLKSPRLHALVGGWILAAVIGISVYGSLCAGHLSHTEYTVTLEKDGGKNQELTVALVADLHLGYNTNVHRIQNLVDQVNAMEPDLICIAGDIFDNDYNAIPEPETIASLLSSLRSTYGTYACYGNHDLDEAILMGFTFDGKQEEPDARLQEFLDASQIHLLEDETILLDHSFYLSGRKDYSRVRKTEEADRLTPSQLTQGLDPEKPLLVMDHQPRELNELADAGVDLVLSGHTHDGQIWPFTLLIHSYWENPCGLLEKNGMTSIVTSGAGVWGPNMRVGTQNEVVEIHLAFSGDKLQEDENPSL